jgi:Fe2+ transport system protein FeoA
MNLSNLKKNESGVISEIRLSGSIKRRLSEMGMTPGATVKMLRSAPLGDPIEFRVLNCNISIRKKDAEKMFIHKVVK